MESSTTTSPTTTSPTRIGLLYEHPTWSLPLIERFTDRGIEVELIDVGSPRSPLAGSDGDRLSVDRWVNRVNALPSAGRPASVVAATGHLLLGLELRGHRVVNGHRTWALGASKAAQVELFAHLGLGTPASIAIDDPAAAMAAGQVVGFPLLIKPNVGGSGSGIERYDRPEDLERAVAGGTVALGIDGTGLVQQMIEPADGLVHRVEMLGTDVFYATDQVAEPGVFNYCAADGCAVDGGIALVEPDAEVVVASAAVMAASGADVGGIEYLIDGRTGRPCFFDFNPYSNFVTGRASELGFDPIDRYIDHVLG